MNGFFFYGQHFSRWIELRHSISLRVMNMIREDAAASRPHHRVVQQVMKIMTIENVVSQHESREIIADEGRTDHERLRQSIGRWLNRILKVEPPLRTGSKELLEPRGVLWRRNNKNLANSCQHQCGERIIDHRFVEHRQELLADRQRCRMETRSRATGENDAL